MKVLIVGHACSPRRGSELAFTWNWSWELSHMHEVWVLTHPQERKYIEGFLATHPNRNLHFVWVMVPRWLDTWNPATDKNVSPLHYILWQRAALRQATALHSQIGFDVVHHVSWGTVSEPPPLWRLPIPFVWGPVGGGQVSPKAFRRYFGPAWKSERLRSLRVRLSTHRLAFKRAARNSALVLATNHESLRLLRRGGAQNARLFLDSGVRDDFLPPMPPKRDRGKLLKLLWAGVFEWRKCLPLAMEALRLLEDVPLRLLVAGKGPLKADWQRRAEGMGLNGRVEFLGYVPHSDMPALYRSADAFLFTSIRDSFGSQVLEAMAAGAPIITLNHQGVGAFVPDGAGIKVPVTAPPETVAGLAKAIRTIASSDESRGRMGLVGWEFARSQRWSVRAKVMAGFYEEVIRGMSAEEIRSKRKPVCSGFATSD